MKWKSSCIVKCINTHFRWQFVSALSRETASLFRTQVLPIKVWWIWILKIYVPNSHGKWDSCQKSESYVCYFKSHTQYAYRRRFSIAHFRQWRGWDQVSIFLSDLCTYRFESGHIESFYFLIIIVPDLIIIISDVSLLLIEKDRHSH